MKDFTRVCKLMRIGRCTRAIDFVQKWDCQTEGRESSSDSEGSLEQAMIREDESCLELISYSKEARQSNQLYKAESKEVLDQDEGYRQQWYVRNSQYLDQVVLRGVGEFINRIDTLIN